MGLDRVWQVEASQRLLRGMLSTQRPDRARQPTEIGRPGVEEETLHEAGRPLWIGLLVKAPGPCHEVFPAIAQRREADLRGAGSEASEEVAPEGALGREPVEVGVGRAHHARANLTFASAADGAVAPVFEESE